MYFIFKIVIYMINLDLFSVLDAAKKKDPEKMKPV